MRTRGHWVGVLIVVAAACGSEEESNLAHYADEVRTSVDAVQSELTQHHEEVVAQTDLRSIADIEERHMQAMMADMGRMDGAWRSLALCNDRLDVTMRGYDAEQDLADAMDDMHDAVDASGDEVARHWRAMHGMNDLDEAFAEEGRHETSMGDLLDRMGNHEGHMMRALSGMDGGHMMMCPMYSHMHGW